MAAVKALQQWCRIQCDGYRDVSITNMTTSFRDGLAFCALIHKHRPDLIDFDSLKKENVFENNKLAFRVAEDELGIPALLDAEDMVALKVPDRLSILTYVSQYYNYFHGRSPIGGMGGIKRPAEGSTDEPSGKKNQPVVAKVWPPSKPARENSPPPSSNIARPSSSPKPTRSNTTDVPVYRPHTTGTLSNKCVSCNKHVHLVQRHLVDGKLYHRNCAKSLSPTTSTTPLRDLPTNTPVSKFTPLPDTSSKHITTAPTKPPSRLGPTWLTEKPSVPSSIPTASSISFPARPAAGVSSTAKESRAAPVTQPTTSRTTCDSTFTTTPSVNTRPTPAPRTSLTAAKTVQDKLRFFQADGDTATKQVDQKKTTAISVDVNKDQKKTTAISMDVNKDQKKTTAISVDVNKDQKKTKAISVDVNKGTNKNAKVQEATAGQTVTVLLNVGGTGKKGTSPNLDKRRDVTRAVGPGGKVSVTPEDNGNNVSKASAAAFISKKLSEGNNDNNTKPSWTSVTLKKTEPPSEVQPPKKDTAGVRGRVKLRVDPSLLADLQPTDATTSPPSPASRTGLRARTPDRGSPKPARAASPNTAAASESEAPADWRSRLKPVGKDTKHTAPPQPTKPTSVASSNALTPSISITPPPSKALQNGSGEQTANGTKSESKTSKIRPDHIPREDIIKELQEIEDNLNELEKRGVELEMKLRRSEEEGEDESLMDELMVEWFNLIRNKQVAMRRESELVYIGRTQDLEEQQPTVEQELRRLMDKPEHLKTSWEKKREEQLMEKLVSIVNDRNAIVEGLDEDRLREEEEDEQLNKMMLNFNVKKDKPKKKVSKLFSWGNKKEG